MNYDDPRLASAGRMNGRLGPDAIATEQSFRAASRGRQS
jgi:hypothetical protein